VQVLQSCLKMDIVDYKAVNIRLLKLTGRSGGPMAYAGQAVWTVPMQALRWFANEPPVTATAHMLTSSTRVMLMVVQRCYSV
jgi:hypothetical protein